jgi:hypothetical protein
MQFIYSSKCEPADSGIIPPWASRAMAKANDKSGESYTDLPESEKASDLIEADKILKIVQNQA